MQVQMYEIKVVTLGDLEAQWKIPPSDVIMVGNQPFVRLRTNNWGLVSLVLEDNPGAPPKVQNKVSLACCKGLQHLCALRNAAQAESLVPKDGSTLFASPQPSCIQPKRKKPKTSRIEQQLSRQQPEPITIDVILDGSTHSIEVLRPVAASDAVYVKYEASTLDIVLKLLRSGGFTGMQTHNKHSGPKGIWKRGAKYVVAKDVDGKKTYQEVASWDDAVLLACGEAAAGASAWYEVFESEDVSKDAEGEGHEMKPLELENASKDAEGKDHESEAASNDAEASDEGYDYESEAASNAAVQHSAYW